MAFKRLPIVYFLALMVGSVNAGTHNYDQILPAGGHAVLPKRQHWSNTTTTPIIPSTKVETSLKPSTSKDQQAISSSRSETISSVIITSKSSASATSGPSSSVSASSSQHGDASISSAVASSTSLQIPSSKHQSSATPSSATPSSATPSSATPSSATPSSATPSSAVPSSPSSSPVNIATPTPSTTILASSVASANSQSGSGYGSSLAASSTSKAEPTPTHERTPTPISPQSSQVPAGSALSSISVSSLVQDPSSVSSNSTGGGLVTTPERTPTPALSQASSVQTPSSSSDVFIPSSNAAASSVATPSVGTSVQVPNVVSSTSIVAPTPIATPSSSASQSPAPIPSSTLQFFTAPTQVPISPSSSSASIIVPASESTTVSSSGYSLATSLPTPSWSEQSSIAPSQGPSLPVTSSTPSYGVPVASSQLTPMPSVQSSMAISQGSVPPVVSSGGQGMSASVSGSASSSGTPLASPQPPPITTGEAASPSGILGPISSLIPSVALSINLPGPPAGSGVAANSTSIEISSQSGGASASITPVPSAIVSSAATPAASNGNSNNVESPSVGSSTSGTPFHSTIISNGASILPTPAGTGNFTVTPTSTFQAPTPNRSMGASATPASETASSRAPETFSPSNATSILVSSAGSMFPSASSTVPASVGSSILSLAPSETGSSSLLSSAAGSSLSTPPLPSGFGSSATLGGSAISATVVSPSSSVGTPVASESRSSSNVDNTGSTGFPPRPTATGGANSTSFSFQLPSGTVSNVGIAYSGTSIPTGVTTSSTGRQLDASQTISPTAWNNATSTQGASQLSSTINSAATPSLIQAHPSLNSTADVAAFTAATSEGASAGTQGLSAGTQGLGASTQGPGASVASTPTGGSGYGGSRASSASISSSASATSTRAAAPPLVPLTKSQTAGVAVAGATGLLIAVVAAAYIGRRYYAKRAGARRTSTGSIYPKVAYLYDPPPPGGNSSREMTMSGGTGGLPPPERNHAGPRPSMELNHRHSTGNMPMRFSDPGNPFRDNEDPFRTPRESIESHRAPSGTAAALSAAMTGYMAAAQESPRRDNFFVPARSQESLLAPTALRHPMKERSLSKGSLLSDIAAAAYNPHLSSQPAMHQQFLSPYGRFANDSMPSLRESVITDPFADPFEHDLLLRVDPRSETPDAAMLYAPPATPRAMSPMMFPSANSSHNSLLDHVPAQTQQKPSSRLADEIRMSTEPVESTEERFSLAYDPCSSKTFIKPQRASQMEPIHRGWDDIKRFSTDRVVPASSMKSPSLINLTPPMPSMRSLPQFRRKEPALAGSGQTMASGVRRPPNAKISYAPHNKGLGIDIPGRSPLPRLNEASGSRESLKSPNTLSHSVQTIASKMHSKKKINGDLDFSCAGV